MPDYPFEKVYDINRITFFDIETTGFSAEASYLYLIGCAYYKDHSFHLIQWFSESIAEEALLINTFFEFLKNYDVLIHYNGSGFDIPYLQKKSLLLNLNHSFNSIISIDLYKQLYPYKKIFKLTNLKLKTLETFLNVRRQDVLDGADLISMYQSYLGKRHYENLWKARNQQEELPFTSEADILLEQILLHNADDIRGLLSVCPILQYVDLFEKRLHILQAGITEDILEIKFETSAKLPARINYGNDVIHLTAFDSTATISVHVFEGELKYFYDNYKDYYYLPAEDYAIHKSVAHFVDKDYRVKAKPSNCYTRKKGVFVPQYEMIITPYFKTNYQDKLTFLEVHTDFLLQEEKLELYVTHLMSHLVSK